MPKLRGVRVNEEVRRQVGDIIQNQLKDPGIRSMVSVLRAEVTSDLSVAKVYVSLYGPEKDHEAAWQGLNKALGFMRTEIAKRIRLRFAPNLILVKDTSMEYSAHIEGLLKKIKEEEGPSHE